MGFHFEVQGTKDELVEKTHSAFEKHYPHATQFDKEIFDTQSDQLIDLIESNEEGEGNFRVTLTSSVELAKVS